MGDDLAPRSVAPGLESAPAGQSLRQSAYHPSAAHGLPPGAVILEQDFDFGSLYALRAAVSAHASAAGLSGSRLYDVVTTAHELAANAVRHGAGRGHLRLWVLDGILHCEVTDAGRPADRTAPGGPAPDDRAPGGAALDGAALDGAALDGAGAADQAGGGVTTANGEPAPWRMEHGHGLWVVSQIADQFSVDRSTGATTATATFALGAASDLAADRRSGPAQPDRGHRLAGDQADLRGEPVDDRERGRDALR